MFSTFQGVSTSDSLELVVDCCEALCYKTGTVTALNRLDVLMETEERNFYVSIVTILTEETIGSS